MKHEPIALDFGIFHRPVRFFSNNRDPRDDGQVFMAIIFILAGSSIATIIVSVVAIVCGCVL